jgi:hypothetical protein
MDRMRDIENLAYWKSTSDQSELLAKYWENKNLENSLLKNQRSVTRDCIRDR